MQGRDKGQPWGTGTLPQAQEMATGHCSQDPCCLQHLQHGSEAKPTAKSLASQEGAVQQDSSLRAFPGGDSRDLRAICQVSQCRGELQAQGCALLPRAPREGAARGTGRAAQGALTWRLVSCCCWWAMVCFTSTLLMLCSMAYFLACKGNGAPGAGQHRGRGERGLVLLQNLLEPIPGTALSSRTF